MGKESFENKKQSIPSIKKGVNFSQPDSAFIGKPISPEEFFEKNVEIHHVSKKEFFEIIKSRYGEITEDQISSIKGVNINFGDKVKIFLRTDVIPKEYMQFGETHEKWEAYLANKEGYNLGKKSEREYKRDKNIGNFNKISNLDYLFEKYKYNYEFRHEYAVYKEYQQALENNILDEYHKWFLGTKEEEKSKIKGDSPEFKKIENDIKIRESIYKKLKEGGAHVFTRN